MYSKIESLKLLDIALCHFFLAVFKRSPRPFVSFRREKWACCANHIVAMACGLLGVRVACGDLGGVLASGPSACLEEELVERGPVRGLIESVGAPHMPGSGHIVDTY